MVRLTPELIEESQQYMNPIREYELRLRGKRERETSEIFYAEFYLFSRSIIILGVRKNFFFIILDPVSVCHPGPYLGVGWSYMAHLGLIRTRISSSCPFGVEVTGVFYFLLKFEKKKCFWSIFDLAKFKEFTVGIHRKKNRFFWFLRFLGVLKVFLKILFQIRNKHKILS